MKPKAFIVTVILAVCLSSCCRDKIRKCPDGRPVSFTSRKCALKAYEDDVKTFDFNMKATVNIVDKVTVGVDNLQLKNEATLLKEKLDQESIRLEATLKASYLAMCIDPCENSERHYKILKAVNDRNYELQRLKANLESQTKEMEILSVFRDVLYERGKKEGIAMGQLTRVLENYYKANKKYPESLSILEVSDLITTLGENRLEYKLKRDNEFLLTFASEDYVLGSSDDKIYRGIDGVTEVVKQA